MALKSLAHKPFSYTPHDVYLTRFVPALSTEIRIMTAYTPNLPALITALPSDPGSGPGAGRNCAPQEPDAAASIPAGCCPHCAAPLPGADPVPASAEGGQFTRARQVAFLENLSVTGSVRSAACAAQVSHQTAYRARRATAAFRTAWDAALLVARAAAADVLACRAIDGVEEKVFYRGEEIGSRTRYSDRLLLAHLARLDALAETPAAADFAEEWDAALARFAAGEGAPANLSPGPCNTRSKSPAAAPPSQPATATAPAPAPAAESQDADTHGAADAKAEEDWIYPPDEVTRACAGESAEEAGLPVVDRLLAAMARHRGEAQPARPAPRFGSDHEAWQMEAFVAGVAEWWRVIPPPPGEPEDEWCYAESAEEE